MNAAQKKVKIQPQTVRRIKDTCDGVKFSIRENQRRDLWFGNVNGKVICKQEWKTIGWNVVKCQSSQRKKWWL